ncbi:hypothetical protein JJB07_16560 [Tumebacillus sp. ITR2]|uniref:Uncharacterized protein n=1 Tax=Tumebacillus amylolyticus TaxID=2801339 RepID=A0ABS1JD69_9BACL|nr:hypothetical protein [Tumebacillus amylolyticus]MBL0388227.1 hypothetical protein [Tumebacillus amylolyticus]
MKKLFALVMISMLVTGFASSSIAEDRGPDVTPGFVKMAQDMGPDVTPSIVISIKLT